jgi:hypothetical protein
LNVGRCVGSFVVCTFVVFSQAALAQKGAVSESVKETKETAERLAPPTRPALLVPLYSSYIALQGLDIHSTLTTVGSGRAREANPLLREVAHSSSGLIALKAASTMGVIWGTEKLWKKNRVAAVLLMVGVNSAMTYAVARNYRHVP